MNADRRKRLGVALEELDLARQVVEGVRDEELEAYDNLPESLKQAERGEAMDEAIRQLEEAISNIEYAEDACNSAIGS